MIRLTLTTKEAEKRDHGNEVAVVECNLRPFKTIRLTINHTIHEQVYTIFYLLLFTPSHCFHSNFRIALYNLFMHSSLTNQKRNFLLSI